MRKHRSKPVASAADTLVNIDDDARHLERVVFTDEAMFPIERCRPIVQIYSCKIWGSEQSKEVLSM